MGIDVYLEWDGKTEAEDKAQVTGFSVTSGDVGYLREAYHGAPYATKVMFPEAWGDKNECRVPSSVLRERLADTLEAAAERERLVYKGKRGDAKPVLKSFTDFVALHERLEREGRNPYVIVSY